MDAEMTEVCIILYVNAHDFKQIYQKYYFISLCKSLILSAPLMSRYHIALTTNEFIILFILNKSLILNRYIQQFTA